MKRGEDTIMKFSTIKHFFVDALKSLKRNKTISIASALTVSATLFIFGVFILIAVTVNNQVEVVESMVEVKVYLQEDVTLLEQRAIENKVKEVPGIKEVVFESRAQAMENFKSQSQSNKEILEGYGSENNPFQSALVVKIDSPEVAKDVEEAVKNLVGVDQVGNQKDIIDKIISVSSTIKWVGVAMFIVLVAVSLFLISNTIKLTVFSRRREIGIMKFVGATDWFIRWPFIIEGMIIGLIGALVSDGLLYFGYKVLYTNVTNSLIGATPLVAPTYVATIILLEFIAAGILVGAAGSFISLRKFLEV